MRDEYPHRLEDLKHTLIETLLALYDEHPKGRVLAQQYFNLAEIIWERSRADEDQPRSA